MLVDNQINKLVFQIVQSLDQDNKSTIAVIPFSDLHGKTNDFGIFLSEELTTRLFRTNRFQVVERQLLNEVVNEQKLNVSGLIDDNTAASVGRLLGLEAIVAGTITDLGSSIKVNTRLISTNTGTVFAVASVLIFKDSAISALLNRPCLLNDTQSIRGNDKADIQNKTFFYEDFSTIEEGAIPEYMIGASTLLVKSSARKNEKCLAPFKKGNHRFIMSDIDFPENWRLNLHLLHSVDGYNKDKKYGIILKIGEFEVKYDITRLSFRKDKTRLFFNGVNTKKTTPAYNQVNVISVEKRNSILKLYVNSEKIYTLRDECFEKPQSISFSSTIDFCLYKIEGRELD